MNHTSDVAGGVVIGIDGRIVVVNQNSDSWSLPKGHVEPGETARQAAEREIREETGLDDVEYIADLGSYTRYKIGKGGSGEDTTNQKHITMYLYRTSQQQLRPEDPTNPEARWVNQQDVAAHLTHHKDREFFESIQPDIAGLLHQ